jgi:hypothetical protein
VLTQIGNTPSNLQIADYSLGLTGSVHDTTAFQHTIAIKHPDLLFDGEEFAWADSAYAVSTCTIPVHKWAVSLDPANTLFDHVLAQFCVWSEHCMGALKGCFQCLHGLQVNINSNSEHAYVLCWITVAIILHNLIIDVEENSLASHFLTDHGHEQEFENRGGQHEPQEDDENNGVAKWRELVAELIAFNSTKIHSWL